MQRDTFLQKSEWNNNNKKTVRAYKSNNDPFFRLFFIQKLTQNKRMAMVFENLFLLCNCVQFQMPFLHHI